MPGTEPELLRPGDPTPITLSVVGLYLELEAHKSGAKSHPESM